ncbi:hypothetical protein XHV734_1293 [Xanthomonas hortorum pv. vitians]|nr:hypothetical protein XHV734_1293 [Xanthomonas hortorum pv. vitians]
MRVRLTRYFSVAAPSSGAARHLLPMGEGISNHHPGAWRRAALGGRLETAEAPANPATMRAPEVTAGVPVV